MGRARGSQARSARLKKPLPSADGDDSEEEVFELKADDNDDEVCTVLGLED